MVHSPDIKTQTDKRSPRWGVHRLGRRKVEFPSTSHHFCGIFSLFFSFLFLAANRLEANCCDGLKQSTRRHSGCLCKMLQMLIARMHIRMPSMLHDCSIFLYHYYCYYIWYTIGSASMLRTHCIHESNAIKEKCPVSAHCTQHAECAKGKWITRMDTNRNQKKRKEKMIERNERKWETHWILHAPMPRCSLIRMRCE